MTHSGKSAAPSQRARGHKMVFIEIPSSLVEVEWVDEGYVGLVRSDARAVHLYSAPFPSWRKRGLWRYGGTSYIGMISARRYDMKSEPQMRRASSPQSIRWRQESRSPNGSRVFRDERL